MDLKEYVQNVIEQISEAITENNGQRGTENAVLVNPALSKAQFFEGEQYAIDSQNLYIKITNVEFEISLVGSKEIEAGGKVGVKLLAIDGTKKDVQHSSNKVRFTLPVLFPSAQIVDK